MIHNGSASVIDLVKMELIPESEISKDFPVACYEYDLCDRQEPWHWHAEFEFGWMVSGSAILNVEGEKQEIQTGDGYFLNSNAMHSILPGKKENCRIQTYIFRDEIVGGTKGSIFYKKYLDPLTTGEILTGVLLHKDNVWQSNILRNSIQVIQLCKKKKEGYESKVREILTNILSCILANSIPADNNKPMKNKLVPRIKPMLLYIWQNYNKEITLEDIASAAMVSKNECMACFRKTLAVSPMQYLEDYRIQKAKGYLSETTMHVIEIAKRTGFSSQSYFTKVFRNSTGLTPLEYRKLHHNDL